jgi:hypothetical protein
MTRPISAVFHRSSKLLLALAFVITTACSGDSPTGPTDNTPVPSGTDPVAGTFTLTTVNALALPFTLFNESGYVLQMTASTLALETNGQYILAATTRETVAGFPSTFVDTMRGTWTQKAATVTLTRSGAPATTAVWNGTTLSFPYQAESGELAVVYTMQR